MIISYLRMKEICFYFNELFCFHVLYFIFSYRHLHSKKCFSVRVCCFCQKEFSFIVQKCSFSCRALELRFSRNLSSHSQKKSPKNSFETFSKSFFIRYQWWNFCYFYYLLLQWLFCVGFQLFFYKHFHFKIKWRLNYLCSMRGWIIDYLQMIFFSFSSEEFSFYFNFQTLDYQLYQIFFSKSSKTFTASWHMAILSAVALTKIGSR